MRAALLAALLLAGAAAAHGASLEEVREFGPYKVTFFGYSYTTPAEQIRPAWKVTEASTGRGVPMNGTILNVTTANLNNRTVGAYDKELSQTTPGFLFTDLLTGARGEMRFRFPLPGGAVAAFTQVVCDVDSEGQLACGPLQGRQSPGPEAALLALAGAGLAALLRRRP